jgi:hypothetical protein
VVEESYSSSEKQEAEKKRILEGARTRHTFKDMPPVT